MHLIHVRVIDLIETDKGPTARLETTGDDPVVFNMDVVNTDLTVYQGESYDAELFGLCINLSVFPIMTGNDDPMEDELIASGLFPSEAQDSAHAWISGMVTEVKRDERNEGRYRTSLTVRTGDIEAVLFTGYEGDIEPGYRIQASVLLYGNLLDTGL